MQGAVESKEYEIQELRARVKHVADQLVAEQLVAEQLVAEQLVAEQQVK